METVGGSGVFHTFGIVAASYLGFKLACSILSGLRAYVFSGASVNFKKLGEWAVVTGATDGIGKGYAHELARKGVNIVLISRSPEKLADVATEIEKKHSVKTKTVAIDFTGGPEIYDTIKDEILQLEIGVVVNNVGMSYPHPEYVNLVDEKRMLDILRVNMNSVTLITRMVLPKMIERGKGAIINISSGSAVNPTPLLTVYSATKAYVDFFSRALQLEVANKGVIVQCVKPFFVATKMSGIRRTSFFTPGPEAYARAALGTVGKQTSTFGCLSHALQAWFLSSINTRVHGMLTVHIMGRVKQWILAEKFSWLKKAE